MATRMQQRRGTAAQWTGANPILAAGEIGFETDTGKFKIGNGSSAWSALNYYVDANAILDGAPGVLDTLNELAAALGDDPAFITTVATNLSTHSSDTTNVHGITNTANLATLDDVTDAVSNAEVNQSTLAGVGIDFNVGTNQFDIDSTVVTLTGTQELTNKTLVSADLGGNSVATTQNGTDSTTKIATTEFVQGRISSLIAGAPELLNTLSELSAAIADDEDFAVTITAAVGEKVAKAGDTMTGILTLSGTPTEPLHAATKGYADNLVNDHNDLTQNIHGITNTGDLATKNYADTAAEDAADGAVGTHTALTISVHGIDDTSLLATKDYADTAASDAADSAIETHRLDTTNVHGIANTADIVLTNDSRLSDTRTPTDNTVTTAKIVDSNVTADKLAGDSVTTAKILDGAVTSAKIENGTIVNANINNSAAIAQSKISGLTADLAAKAPLASPTFTGTVSGITKSMVGLGNVDNTADADKPVSSATQTALNLKANLAGPTFTGTVSLPSTTSIGDVSATELGYLDGVTSAIQTQLTARLPLAGGTMTGALTLSGAPTSDLHAATKAYVDNVTAGINFHEAVHAASVSSLSANYANGTSGVGATLTADTNRAFSTLDGESVTLGQRVLIKNQTDAKQNGIYTLTTVGSVSAPWVLTRATDADNNPTGEMKTGDFTFVINGTVNASVGYINNSTANPIVIGTDNISYTEFNAGKTVVAGSGLTEATPGTLSVATGGVTSAMIADGAIVDADINASAAIAQSKISGLTSDLAAKAPLASPTFTGTVTLPAAGIVFSDGTQSKEGVPSRTPIIQKSGAYTLSALTERDSLIEVSAAGAITIPADSTLNFPIGTSIDVLQTGTGAVSIAAGAGVTANATPGLTLRTQWSSATLLKRAANTWVVYGDLK